MITVTDLRLMEAGEGGQPVRWRGSKQPQHRCGKDGGRTPIQAFCLQTDCVFEGLSDFLPFNVKLQN